MIGLSLYPARTARKASRAARVLEFMDGFRRAEREYRVRFEQGIFYPEFRDRWRWHKIPSLVTWVSESYTCASRDEAIALIDADRSRLARWAATTRIEHIA